MEIESFEPYHIGTKLKPNVDILALKKKLKSILKEKKYKIIEDSVSSSALLTLEDWALKDEARIVFNPLAHAINTIGDNQDNVIKIFEELINIIFYLGYEEKSTIAFYEIIVNVSIKPKEPPIEILNKHSKLVLDLLKDCGKLNTIGIRLSDNLPMDDKEYIEVVIEPKSTSPNTNLVVHIVFRSPDKEKLIKFHKNMKTNIQKIIQTQ